MKNEINFLRSQHTFLEKGLLRKTNAFSLTLKFIFKWDACTHENQRTWITFMWTYGLHTKPMAKYTLYIYSFNIYMWIDQILCDCTLCLSRRLFYLFKFYFFYFNSFISKTLNMILWWYYLLCIVRLITTGTRPR